MDNVPAKVSKRFEASNKKTCLHLSIVFDNKLIEEVESDKYLGHNIDNDLNGV
jgi:hypothetical protein